MIILDTNVVSAQMRSPPDAAVLNWLDLQPASSVWITAVTLYEIKSGLSLMPDGRRRIALEASFETMLNHVLESRVLDFDRAAAIAAAGITARRRLAGVTVDLHDTQIAGIAVAHRGTIATRNVRHFNDVDIPVVNPWEA